MPTTWRFIAECECCNETINLGPAPSPEEKEPATHAGLQIDCPHCGAALTLAPGQVSRALVDAPQE